MADHTSRQERVADAVDNLTEALFAAWAACGPPDEASPGIYAGTNLAELLAEALTRVAHDVGGTEVLVWHRPGCWEADHIRALAAPIVVRL